MDNAALLKELRDIRNGQARIETALMGDQAMGNPGIVKRVGAVEGKVKTLQNERLKLVGAVAGASAVISLLVTYIFGH